MHVSDYNAIEEKARQLWEEDSRNLTFGKYLTWDRVSDRDGVPLRLAYLVAASKELEREARRPRLVPSGH